MNWLTNYVRPKIKALVTRSELPDNLWHKCPACGQMNYHKEMTANLWVCPHCGHHIRLSPRERLNLLMDDGRYERVEVPKTAVDPLRFRDGKRYSERLKTAQNKTGESDAVIVAEGEVGGVPVVVVVFNFEFMGGSMGIAVGEALVSAAARAIAARVPLIAIPASGGARMQEGILSLMQMPRTVIAVERVKEAGLPYIVVLTDPTTGGVSASFAMLGDVQLAEPGAVIGFAGSRVIEETIRESLPEGFQRAEYLLEHGMVDIVVRRQDLKPTLANLLSLLIQPDLRDATEDADPAAAPAIDDNPPADESLTEHAVDIPPSPDPDADSAKPA